MKKIYKKVVKKALSVFLVVVMLLTSAPLQGFTKLDFSWLSFNASAASYSGTCGDNVTWVFDDETGILTLDGTGEMKNYNSPSSLYWAFNFNIHPWKKYCSQIKTIIINDGITAIGNYAFARIDSLENIVIPESVDSIGTGAFGSCTSLKSIAIYNNETTFGAYSFGYDYTGETLYSDLLIYGTIDSSAHEYANNNGITFQCIHAYNNEVPIESDKSSLICGDVIKYTCTECGQSWNDNKAIVHDYELVSCVCDCITGGIDTYTCSRCGDTYTENFAARHVDADNDGFCDYCLNPFGGVLDLVFIIDSTGSMSDEINVVKESIQTYADMLSQSNIPHYIALVDFSNDKQNNGLNNYYNINFDFTNDEETIAKGISNLTTKGGSDEPAYSAIINGLEELHWGVNSTRRIILIGDEEPWSNETVTGYNYDKALESLQNNDISVYSIATGGTNVSSFRTLAESTNGNYYQSSDSAEFADTLIDIIDSIPESIHLHDYAETIITSATCLKDGLASYKCTGCGRKLENVVLSALGHNYVSKRIEATDELEEHTRFTCSRCNDSYIVLDPATPVEGLQAFAGTYTVSLSWLKSVEASVTGYKVYRKLAADTEFALIKTISSRNTTSFVDKDLTAGYEYVYVVTALKDNVEGLQCDPVICIPNADEEEPRVLKLEPSKVVNDVITGTIKFAINAEDNIGVVKFELYYSPENTGEWKLVSEYKGAAANISFNTKSVPDGVYSFKAIAYDAMGNSGDGSIVKTYTVDNTGPEKVTGFNTKAVYASKATIAWKNVSDKDINHFILRRKTDTGYTIVSNSISGVLGYNLEGLLPDTQYTYSVAGVDHYGNVGEYSDDFSFTTLADTTAPVVTSLSPASGRYNSSIGFKATVTDDCGIASITIQSSLDGVIWENVKTYTYSDNKTSKTCTHTISLQNYNEGAVYIRAIATDTTGNISNTSESAPFIQYYIDKTAPSKPAGVSAVGGDGYIQIKWNKSSEGDLSGYYVYRSTTENGAFTKISSKLTTLNHYDRNVNRDTTYYYKVEAVDTCGNVSGQSTVVSAKALSDTIKPTIESISPAYGSAISANNNQIGILANDNNMLKSIVVEYKDTGDYKVLKTFDNVNASNKVVYVSLPINSYNHGDVVYLRAYCVDAAGYTSEYSSAVKYVIDKVAPGLTNLSCAINSGVCTLKWNDINDSDLSGFKVYRSTNGGSYKSIGSRTYSSSHSYTFNDTVSEGTHKYRIDCVDKSGNSASYYSDSVNWTKPAQIKAIITGETYLEQGVQEVFSASKSTSDNSIFSYLWDFGDGTTSNKINVTKAYNKAGVYTVTLKLTDSQGNVSTASKVITVAERELLGTARVRVVNENGYAVSNAPVYFDLGEENQQIVYTNTSGYASLTMTVGTHVVGSYKNGFLPVSGNVTVLANTTAEITLTMVEQELITGEFEVHEMTFEEIKAAGIDVNDPANQQIYEVKVTLIYGEEKIPVTYVRNDTEIISYTIGNTGGAGPGGGGGGGNHGGGKINHISFVPNEMNQEIIAVVEIPITASYLKQFYSANLHIVNNAAAGYEIVNCEASISVPDGLTVVQHTPISSVIDGQQSSSANWILRGDKAGSYNLSANFSGVLDSFNVPVSASFTADEPVVVYGPDSVKLRIEVEEELNKDLHFNLCLVNKRDVNVNCPQINAPDFVFNITERYKKIIKNENPDGIKDKVALCEFLRVGKVSADGKAEFFDVNDDSQVPIDYLAPGESLVYEYVLKHVTNGQGGTGYFQKAIVDCDEFYKSSIEVVCMSEMPLGITEDQFIKEHLEFIASSEYRSADLEFPARVSEALKEEWEDDWYQFIELDYSTNYAEVVLADYMLQKSTYDDMETKYGEYLLTETTDLYASLTRVVKEEFFTDYDDLTEEKIMNIFTGFDYESSEYKHMNDVFKKAPEDSLKNLYKTYYGFDLAMNVWEFGCDTVDSIKKTGKYIAAIIAYRNCMDTYFKEVLSNASAHLGEDEKKMKEAIENFTGSENTAKFAEVLLEEINQTAGAIGFSALKIVFMESFVDLVTISATAAIKTIAAKAGIQIGSAAYAELMSIVGGIAIGVTLGMSVSKVLANTEKLNYTASMMEYYSQLAESLRKELKIREADFLSEPISFEGALYFDSSYKAFKSAWLATAELFLNFAKGKNNSLAVDLFDRDKFSDYINDSAARISSIKQLNCHAANHYVDTTSSKILMVECPVDVTIYDSNGNILAIITNDNVEIFDIRVVATNWDSKKFIALPANEDFKIQITAYDAGTMDYTVLEYSSNINIRRVVFEDIELEKDDVFEGNIDSVLFTDKDNYALTKNNNDVITATEDIEHEVTGITLDKETVTVQCGEIIGLNADIAPSDTENIAITWSSYDETIATVSGSGVVKALKPGEVVVKAVTEDGGYVAYCTVMVECSNHKYGQWSITEQPSCKTEGKQTRVCGYCEHVDDQILEKLKHIGGVATCKDQKICSLCNEPYGELDSNNHAPLDAVVENEIPSKCGIKGSYDLVTYCSLCEKELSRDSKQTEALEHKKETIIGKAPTCTETGLTDGVKCSACGETLTVQQTIGKLAHNDDNGDYMCDYGCGYEFEKPADPTPDVPDKPTDSNCGHICHKSGFMGFIWKIVRFFWKLFKINPICSCGAAHY